MCCPVLCRLACIMNASRKFRKCVPNYSFQKQKVLWRSRPCYITFYISRLWQNIFLCMVKGESTCNREYCVQELRTVRDHCVTFCSFAICNYNRNNPADSSSWKRAHFSTDYKKPLSIQLETVCINGISTSNVRGETSLKKIFILIQEVSWLRKFIRFFMANRSCSFTSVGVIAMTGSEVNDSPTITMR